MGQFFSLDFKDDNSPCLECFFEDLDSEDLTCRESSIFSPLVGVIGSFMASESIKRIITNEKMNSELVELNFFLLNFTVKINISALVFIRKVIFINIKIFPINNEPEIIYKDEIKYALGNIISILAPFRSGLLDALIVALCNSTKFFTIFKPSPECCPNLSGLLL